MTPPKETSSCTFKMAILPKFFGAFIRHLIRKNPGKKIKLFSQLFTNNIFENSFVLFVSKQSLFVIKIYKTNEKVLLHTGRVYEGKTHFQMLLL